MASLVLLLSELLKHQNQDPSGLLLSQTSSPPGGAVVVTATASPHSPAIWTTRKPLGSSLGSCKKEEEMVVQDLPESGFCAELVWP
ncbi:hypothetical protein Acr_15g0016470 [Actinidia rufa]|uniref:Uncharacterized protein n=1 Tax=Actinidia rufa TaxID=165716 RepID=A0A7J0FWH0_9ERIC|nr:hypothetical protein Acr_15g0016470 [Actinidia rufa]